MKILNYDGFIRKIFSMTKITVVTQLICCFNWLGLTLPCIRFREYFSVRTQRQSWVAQSDSKPSEIGLYLPFYNCFLEQQPDFNFSSKSIWKLQTHSDSVWFARNQKLIWLCIISRIICDEFQEQSGRNEFTQGRIYKFFLLGL